jgi:hypothetical protein
MRLRKKQKTDYAQMVNPTQRPTINKGPEHDLCLEQQGASYLKYVTLLKNGQKILVPVRYSIRNRNQADISMTQTALEASYKPNEMEAKFTISKEFQQTALLCRS